MNYFYVGKKRIKKAIIKTKVKSDFITAGAADIVSGKKSIDSNYNPITGTMVINDKLSDLTTGATAIASDVTLGKTGYKNGSKITGTAVRATPKDVIGGIIKSYKVANNNVISAGDFVKFVEEICGCGYETTTTKATEVSIKSGTNNAIILHQYSANKVLVLFNIRDNNYDWPMFGTIITINNGTITYTTPQAFSNVYLSTTSQIISLDNNKFVFIDSYYAAPITINNDIISIGTQVTIVNNGTFRHAVVISSNELFITYEGTDNDGDRILCYSRLKLVNNILTATVNIPTNNVFYVGGNAHTICAVDTNRILLAYSIAFNGTSNVVMLDISNPNNVYTGIVEPLHAISTYSYDSLRLENDIVLLTYYIESGGNGVPYATCIKVNGLEIESWTSIGYGSSASSVTSTQICQLTPTLIIMQYQISNQCNFLIINRTAVGSTGFTFSTKYIFGDTNTATKITKIEDNKFLMVYSKDNGSGYKLMTRLFQVNDGNIFTDTLTIYDMTKPLTATMAALAKEGDTIGGISDKYGVGALYGGDIIDIIIPSI